CEKALSTSEALFYNQSPVAPQIQLRIYPEASHTLNQKGMTGGDLQQLIKKSSISSFVMNGKHVLPLFHTVKTEEEYRDYVLLATLKEPFKPGVDSRVYVLTLGKVAEGDQKALF